MASDLPDLCIIGGLRMDSPCGHPSKSMAEAWLHLGGRVLYGAVPRQSWRSCPIAQRQHHFWHFDLSPSFGLPRTWPELWRKLQNGWSRVVLNKALRSSGFERKETVFLYYGWFWEELAKDPGYAHIYDCIDDTAAFPHIAQKPWMRNRVIDGERRMAAATQAVIVTSPVLAQRLTGIARHIEFLPNGVDLGVWQTGIRQTIPESLNRLPVPRIILFGNLQSKLDYGLVESLARQMPAYGFALIGSPLPDVMLPKERENLRWHDGIPQDELAAWMHAMDVGIVPLRNNPLNQASCPLKVLEYLAAGLPVVASRIPMTEYWQNRFPTRIFLADSLDEWTGAISQALAAGKTPLSPSEADACSWEARVHALLKMLPSIQNR